MTDPPAHDPTLHLVDPNSQRDRSWSIPYVVYNYTIGAKIKELATFLRKHEAGKINKRNELVKYLSVNDLYSHVPGSTRETQKGPPKLINSLFSVQETKGSTGTRYTHPY